MVSGTISLFCSKCFSPFLHSTGSLSVSREYLALPDGPGRFTQNSSCSALLRIPLRSASLRVRDCHPLRTDFPDCSTHETYCDDAVLQPPHCRNRTGLGSSPFARHYRGNHSYFLFLRVLRCFSSPRSPPPSGGWYPFRVPGCPIRRSAGQWPFAPNRGFSQLITSFIASESQGIRHVPLITFVKHRARPSRKVRGIYFRLSLFFFRCTACHRTCGHLPGVENNGFEPLTPCLQSRCSSQLS